MGMGDYDPERVRQMKRPHGLPFSIGKIGHVVLNVQDVERSARFYTEVLGFQISDVYPEEMVPGGMVFLRCNTDHHGIALVGSTNAPAQNVELNHLAFEVGSLDDVVRARDHLRRHGVTIDFEGRRRAGCQLAVEFRDPNNHRLEIYWGIDQIGSDGHIRPPTEWKGARSLEDAVADPVRGQDTSLRDASLLKR
jgi:catechol 2,3-dioxygenase-like lactoylglutathione lyase family enzyme